MITVPERGAFVCEPGVSAWRSVAGKNMKTAEKTADSADREGWRREIIEVSKKYMNGLGLEVPTLNPGAPFILSAHQPFAYHPGIMFKYRLLAEKSKEEFNALWVTIDTDPCAGYPVKFPSFKNAPRLETRKMLPLSANDFYENSRTDIGSLCAFRDAAVDDLSSVPDNRFKYGISFLRDNVKRNLPERMRDVMLIWRHEYALSWSPAVFEAPLSLICATEGFYRFAFGLLRRADEVRRSFNDTLARYRAEHGIRSKANPFPDLAKKGAGVETLFWKVKGGRREPLFAEGAGKKLRLSLKDWTEVPSPTALKCFCGENGIKIWPRAVALTLMQRFFLGDMFIHGLVGAKYDRVTNGLIRELYKTEPPEFATASCTLPVHGSEDPAPKLAELRQRERKMIFHPEDFLEKTLEIMEIVDKKNSFILEIMKKGADKKTIGAEIAMLNHLLRDKLEPENRKLTGEIKVLEDELARFKVIANRELPFFLFPPDSLP